MNPTAFFAAQETDADLYLFRSSLGKEISADWFYSYAEFNHAFSYGVLHFCYILSKHENVHENSRVIVSNVYEASVEEFKAPCHRILAKNMIEALQEFSPLTDDPTTSMWLGQIKKNVEENYLFGKEITRQSILRALGFHLASEYYASQEFTYIDSWLSGMTSMKKILKDKHAWISAHSDHGGMAEDRHYNHAVMAVKDAVVSDEDILDVKIGIQQFRAIFLRFLAQ